MMPSRLSLRGLWDPKVGSKSPQSCAESKTAKKLCEPKMSLRPFLYIPPLSFGPAFAGFEAAGGSLEGARLRQGPSGIKAEVKRNRLSQKKQPQLAFVGLWRLPKAKIEGDQVVFEMGLT